MIQPTLKTVLKDKKKPAEILNEIVRNLKHKENTNRVQSESDKKLVERIEQLEAYQRTLIRILNEYRIPIPDEIELDATMSIGIENQNDIIYRLSSIDDRIERLEKFYTNHLTEIAKVRLKHDETFPLNKANVI